MSARDKGMVHTRVWWKYVHAQNINDVVMWACGSEQVVLFSGGMPRASDFVPHHAHAPRTSYQ